MLSSVLSVALLYQIPRISRIDPPEQGFFGKQTFYHDIPIKAHADVSDDALVEAYRRMDMVLAKLPRVRERLVKAGAELDIIGKDQVTSDLPEFRHLKGKPFQGKPTEPVTTIDERTRGMGGLKFSCGEENLLRLDQDRYRGRDIMVHEFAHTIHQYGLSKSTRNLITAHYKASMADGKWKGAYAASDEGEFFAELTMWYFGTHGDQPRGSDVPEAGRLALARYDPRAYKMLDELFSGRMRDP
jgi:hypothetical protein